MDGSFACPECGTELTLKGLSPGRQVRCGWCETWVEVPFLPRAGTKPRFRRTQAEKRRRAILAWGLLGVAGLLLAAVTTARLVRSQGRARVEKALAESIDSAKAFEGSGQLDEARAELEKALKTLEALGPGQATRIEALRHQRDQLARRSAQARFAATAALPPDRAIAECLALRKVVRADPTLSGLESAIDERLERSRRLWAESDAAEAKRALEGGHPASAIDLCERLVKTADDLGDHDLRSRLQGQADDLVLSIVQRIGVVIEPARGQFSLGTSLTYDAKLRPPLVALLQRRGFLLPKPKSPWNGLWESHAPTRVTIDVSERWEGSYLESMNRLSILDLRMVLSRRGTTLWKVGPLITRTQVPLPRMNAYQASRVGMGGERSDSFERLLYDNAWTLLLERFSTTIQNPPKFSPTSSPADESS